METELYHLPAKIPERSEDGTRLTGRLVDAPPQVTFQLDGASFVVKVGDEVDIPAVWSYAVPTLAPQLQRGPLPKPTPAAKAS
jgi:hypothetical protein